MKSLLLRLFMFPCLLLMVANCDHVDLGGEDSPDGGPDGDVDVDTSLPLIDVDKVDLLLVIDDSSSMKEEQEMLASRLFVLINSLVAPLPSAPHGGVDDVRVAVTTTNMGLSWGGNPYQAGDGWPTIVPDSCQGPRGDNGAFQPMKVTSIDIEHGAVPCDASGAQCPTGWSCSVTEPEDEGTCQAPGETGMIIFAPHTGYWAGSFGKALTPNLATKAACLAQQGIEGCGFEQQFKAGVKALSRSDQEDFIRDNSLLVVIVVSDEEDCSIKSNDLFYESEIQDNITGLKINLACGNHPEHLYSTQHYYNRLTRLKDDPNEVLFAAIIGVPMVDACQGRGTGLGDCLVEPDMQLVEYQDHDQTGAWFFENACTNGTITEAKPGRRFVELAQDFGPMGYIHSICNDDWTPAMRDIGSTINNLVNID